MIALLLALAAEAAPEVVPSKLLLLPAEPGDAPVALRALASGTTVLVVVQHDGALVRFEGVGERWTRMGDVRARPGVEEVAIDATGAVWTRRGDLVRRWDGDALVPQPLAACIGCHVVRLRPDERAAVEEGGAPTWSVRLAAGLAADVVASAPPLGATRTPRVHGADGSYALEVDGRDAGPALEATVPLVDAVAVADGWVEVVGTRVRWVGAAGGRTGELVDVAPEHAFDVVVRPAGGTTVVVAAWNAVTMRLTTVDPAQASPLRWVEGWLPAGPPIAWPRPAGPRDPVPVRGQLEVRLPAGLEVLDLAVTDEALVLAGTVRTADGVAPAVALVRR